MNRNFDFKKRMNAIHRRNTAYLKKTAAIAATTLLISFPISTTLSTLNVPGFETHVVSAASLAEVKLLTNASINSTSVGENAFNVTYSGTGVGDVDLLGTDKTAIFHFSSGGSTLIDGDLGLTADNATVNVQILPITLGDDTALIQTIDGITGGVTDLTEELLNTIDGVLSDTITIGGQTIGVPPLGITLPSIDVGLSQLLKVEGVAEVQNALDNLNNLGDSVTDLLEYEDTLAVTVDEETGVITVDFADGVGQHLETAVKDLVQAALQDLADALSGLSIELLPDDELEVVLQQILSGALPGIGDLLGQATGLLLSQVKDLVVTPILNPLLETVTDSVGEIGQGITSATDVLTDTALDLSTSYIIIN